MYAFKQVKSFKCLFYFASFCYIFKNCATLSSIHHQISMQKLLPNPLNVFFPINPLVVFTTMNFATGAAVKHYGLLFHVYNISFYSMHLVHRYTESVQRVQSEWKAKNVFEYASSLPTLGLCYKSILTEG